jgi:copper chaperone CopZ
MKSLRLMVAALIVVMSGAISFGQMHDHSKMTTTKTDTFKVLGNCGMCKARIEKAAKIEGVDKADWNEESKVLKVEYNPSEVKSDDILKKVAETGHDNEKFKASDETYKKLPGCCKYDRDTKL